MLEAIKKEIAKIEKEVREEDYSKIPEQSLFGGYPQTQSAYDEGFVDGMKLIKDYLMGIQTLPKETNNRNGE